MKKTEIPSSNIILLTAPLKSQYIVFNPMDQKLLHLLATEHQYLQFIRVLETTRRNANKVSLLALVSGDGKQHIQTRSVSTSSKGTEYYDFVQSFSSDSTEQTKTENMTDSDDEQISLLKDTLPHHNRTSSVIKHDLEGSNVPGIDYLLGDLHLSDEAQFSEDTTRGDNGTPDPEDLTFDDLANYEKLLNDFESTRDEDYFECHTRHTLCEQGILQDIPEILLDANFDDDTDNTTFETAPTGETSFSNYFKRKLTDDDSTIFMSNPQELLKKVSKIWKLIPKNKEKGDKDSDINKDLFHDFYVRWKQASKKNREEKESLKLQTNEVESTDILKLSRQIRLDPDTYVAENQVTDELLVLKIQATSIPNAASPFEYFFNDKVSELLADRKNFNMKKKEIRSFVLVQWEKLSVLEKLRYSSIVIDNNSSLIPTPFASPSKRSVSYGYSKVSLNSQTSLSPPPKLSKKRSVSAFAQGVNIMTPIESMSNDPFIAQESNGQFVKPLSKKKSWGTDDKWL